MKRNSFSLSAVLLLASACVTAKSPAPQAPANAQASPDPVAQPTPVPAETPSAPQAEAHPNASTTPEQAYAWVLPKIKGAALSEEEAKRWFAPSFLQQVPPAALVATMGQMSAQLNPIQELSREAKGNALEALLDTAIGTSRLSLQLDPQTHQIAGLLIRPEGPPPAPENFDAAVAKLKSSAPKVSAAVFRIHKNKCKLEQGMGSKEHLAIGSAFKLWVLSALDRKIRGSSKINYDLSIPIQEQLKSSPTGSVYKQPAGSEMTLRDLAAKMISESDNTATDHLMDYIGHSKVEAELRRTKHSARRKNLPFFNTRDIFALKLAATADEVQAFKKASLSKKRALLKDYRTRPLSLEQAKDWQSPRHLDIEWFANAHDLCGVMAELGTQGRWDTSSDLLKTLAINPGIRFDNKDWKYLGYKGGSEPGVINMTMMGQRSDDEWFVVVVGLNDSEKNVELPVAIAAAEGLVGVTGKDRLSK